MIQESLFTEDSDDAKGPEGPFARVRLTIAYDGTDFRGLAPNTGVRTVVGELVEVLTPIFGIAPVIVMSGRTDAGVHAAEQVLSFDAPAAKVDPDRLCRSINARLGPEVVAIDAEVVDDDFSARFDATGRAYRYRVLTTPVADPQRARTVWHVPEPLDLAAMRLACDPLIGERDFSSFCRRPKPPPGGTPVSLVRRVTSASWSIEGDELHFHIAGSAFCHQMVRSIVGFLVAVGRGRRTAGELLGVLGAQDRARAERPAPPQGLTLMRVRYDAPDGASKNDASGRASGSAESGENTRSRRDGW